jgi:hypothetical protein
MSNMDAARVAEKEFRAEVIVIKKTSKEYQGQQEPIPCPLLEDIDHVRL